MIGLPSMAGMANSFMGGLGSALGGGSAGPSSASAAVYGSGLDGSGWNVNFSGFQSNGSNKASTPESAAGALGVAGPGSSISPLLIVGVVAIIGVAAWAKSKK